MNRVEYANTVRDLFSLDENFARRIEKELPADGKVGGFDRGAAGLFMDDGQLDAEQVEDARIRPVAHALHRV